MKNILLIDFNNLAIRCFFTKDVGGYTGSPEYQIWKYLVFKSVYNYIWKFPDITEVVLAVDDHKSWRRLYFDRYKESRKVKRDKGDVDWDTFHNLFNNYCSEIKQYLPFKTLKIFSCEADDIIGVIAISLHQNNTITIVSNDEDYIQLSNIEGVKVYNPNKQDYISSKDAEHFVVSKCLMGQSKDDIFNVKTSSDWGLTKETQKDDGTPKRKPGLGPKTVEKIMKIGYEKWLVDNKLEENFKRNRVLIDFQMIPEVIRKKILGEYFGYKLPDPSDIYTFFKNNGFREYLENFDNIENKLLTLY